MIAQTVARSFSAVAFQHLDDPYRKLLVKPLDKGVLPVASPTRPLIVQVEHFMYPSAMYKICLFCAKLSSRTVNMLNFNELACRLPRQAQVGMVRTAKATCLGREAGLSALTARC